MKNKLSFFKSDKTKTNYLIYALIFSVIFAFVLYYLTKQILFSILGIIIVIGVYYLFASNLIENSKNKSLINEGKIYIEFYKNFSLFSSLESDYQSGFNRAYDLLPVCKLKEKLDDYKENNLTFEEAMILLSTRTEIGLITEIKRCLLSSTDYYENNSRLSNYIEKYIKEIIPKKSSFDYTSLSILLFASYLIITLLTVYVSKL